MKIYINAAASISPQKTFEAPFETVAYTGNRLRCVEPDYNKLIDPKLIRRMSRIIKMGVASASQCLRDAGVQMPDAIITGTAYGCMEDTEIFLRKMIENREEMLTPTAFIQSTHNTVGAQIALLLKCHNYNNTYVQSGFSFENALLDAMMMLEENVAQNILVGGVDEIIDASHQILTRLGTYRRSAVSNFKLFEGRFKGTIAGEGATFFSLSHEPLHGAVRLQAFETFYTPAARKITAEEILSFLESSGAANEIDLVILGRNGNAADDRIYDEISRTAFDGFPPLFFKHLCGEYPTSSAFALWLAWQIIKKQEIPLQPGPWDKNQKRLNKILIYNHYQSKYHSLFLLSA